MQLIAYLKASQMQRQPTPNIPSQIQRPVVTGIQVQPPQPPPPPKAPKPPKAEVTIKQINLEQYLVHCKLNRVFIEKRLKMQKELSEKLNLTVSFTDNAVIEMATALKLRMTYLTKEAVWYCKQRQTKMYPKERVFVDVPRVNFSILEAEQRILERKEIPTKQQQSQNETIEHLKNETITNLSAQTTDKEHEAFSKLITKSTDEGNTINNYTDIMNLTNDFTQSNLVIPDDIITVMENDTLLSSSPTFLRNFHYNQYKIRQQK